MIRGEGLPGARDHHRGVGLSAWRRPSVGATRTRTALHPSGDRTFQEETRMPDATGRAEVALLIHDVECLTTVDVCGLLGDQVTAQSLSRMRSQRTVVGHRVARVGYLYPAFQFDELIGRIDPLVARTNRVLAKTLNANGALVWWLRPTGAERRSPAAMVGVKDFEALQSATQSVQVECR